MKLNDIKNPRFLKSLSARELQDLSNEIREGIIHTVSEKGGHLSSNLGIVELTVALHYVFDAPKDKIIFDVGHQCYTHKILTGRYPEFSSSLREFKGLSGYQKRIESEYDCYEAGHSSTSISAACGFATARGIKQEHFHVISVIGDASITSGLALEALNNLGTMKEKVIVILNDNNMAISKPVGGLSKVFSRISMSIAYTQTKSAFQKALIITSVGRWMLRILREMKNAIRRFFVGMTLFENMNLDYIGPIDGHNIRKLIRALNTAKNSNRSIVVHVVTNKGKGYAPAEEDVKGTWHGVGKFNIETGKFNSSTSTNKISWSEAIASIVEHLMEQDPTIVAITPAMIEGSKLHTIFEKYPQRSFDVGISEEHAFTFASGLSSSGLKPYISIYSTFMQRAYDEISHDISRMKLPLVVGVDRAGLVGKDGETHQGIYDVGMLKSIPNTVISMPNNFYDAERIYHCAFQSNSCFFIRYPREDVAHPFTSLPLPPLRIGQWDENRAKMPAHATIIVTGPQSEKVVELIDTHSYPFHVVFARFYRPIDTAVLDRIIASEDDIIVYDLYADQKGIYQDIATYLLEHGFRGTIKGYYLPSEFVEHGDITQLHEALHLDIQSFELELQDYLKEHEATN